MLSIDFLAEFKRRTEAQWREQCINPHIYGFQFQPDTRWNPGLSEDKITEFENVLGLQFPHDFRAFLAAMNGTDLPTLNIYGYRPEPPHTSVGAYSYPRDVKIVKQLIEELRENRNALTATLAAQGFDLLPTAHLVPISAHRYLVCTADLNSSVVLSIPDAEGAIVYGTSLQKYLQREFLRESL